MTVITCFFPVWSFITCPAAKLVKGQMTLNKAYSLPSFLSLTPLLFSFLLISALPPTWAGQVARTWGGGIGRLHAEIDYPSNLRTASLSPGPNCSVNSTPPSPPTSSAPNSHPFTDAVPPLSPFLHPFRPSVPVLPEALRDDTKSQPQTGPLSCSPCLVHHMSRQMGLLWTLAWIQEK